MDTEKPAILVVDDNEENRDMLSRRLLRKDLAVTCAAGGREALDLIRSTKFDLVILDIMMPDMSGIEVLAEIRKSASAQQLPVIMATARADSEDVVRALDLGANDYVTKPIDFPVLMARVQAQLRLKPKAAPPPAAASGGTPVVAVGTVLSGIYRIDSAIGTGGFGSVYRARDLKLQRDVAVKVLHGSMVAKPQVLARFQREAVSTCRVKHPNAVMVLDYGSTPDGVPFLVMELLVGVPLSEVLKRDGPMTARRCAEILAPIARLLAEVHAAGVIHRDLKPGNVFLERTRGAGEVVKVVDFGIAKLVGEDSSEEEPLTMEGSILGTPAYMAPERLRGDPVDGRSDVYSLGIMAFEMIAGRNPFRSDQGPLAAAMLQLHEAPPPLEGVPVEFAALVTETLSKDPARRPDAGQFASRIERAVGIDRPGA